MLKGERGFLVLLAAAFISASTAWLLMKPDIPNLPSSEFMEAQESEYSPGSPRCYPSRLSGLSDGEASDERYRCETQAEKHRLEGDDLVQQARAANAAIATTKLTYDQVVWASLGTIFGVLTLLAAAYAAWYARHAAEAAGKANAIALANQRAWVSLKAVPQLVRSDGIDGLYLRLDILAENIGDSVATHFEMDTEIFFMGVGRSSNQVFQEMKTRLEAWKQEYIAGPVSVLLPNDTEKDSVWESYDSKQVLWTNAIGAQKEAHPMILAAVFYRIASDPDTVQLSWRTWYLHSIEKGQVRTGILKPIKELSAKALCVEPHRMNLTHEEFPANDDKDNGGEDDDEATT